MPSGSVGSFVGVAVAVTATEAVLKLELRVRWLDWMDVSGVGGHDESSDG
jgi:hypothetical protein